MQSSSSLLRLSAVISVLAVFCVVSDASAATYTWISTTGSSWQTSENWSSAPTFDNQADVVFTSNLPIDGAFGRTYLGDANRIVRSITFSSGTVAPLIATRENANGVSVPRTLTLDTDSVGGNALVTIDAGAAAATIGGDGAIVLADNLVVGHNGSNSFSINAPMSGAFNLTKNGSGTMVFQGGVTGTSRFAAYSGTTTIAAGTLKIGTGGTLGGLVGTTGITGSSGAVLMIDRSNNVSQATTGAQNSNILNNQSITGGLGLTKAGSGTTTLSRVNTYTGPTLIEAGGLNLGANGSIANSSTITIGAGAAFNVASVNGGFALSSGQTLGGKGTLAGNANFVNGSILAVDPLTSGTLATTGSLTFGNNFGISNISVPSWNALATGTYTIVAGAQDFTTAGLQNFGFNQKATVSGTQQAYFAASGNNLQLVVVPEPATIALAVGGLVSVGFVGLRRLRRRG